MLVINLGEYLDPVRLVGEVNLEEGTGITITRDDAHNSLVIATTVAPGIDPWDLNIYRPSLESLDAWNLGFCQGSGQVRLTGGYMRLSTGAINDSVAHACLETLGHANLRHDAFSRVRFIFHSTNFTTDVKRWWTLGLPTSGNNAYGFYSKGDTLYIYSRNGAGASTVGTGITLASGQTYRLEAEYTPGVGVQAYVDGVDVGDKGLDLPDADGFGLSMRMTVDVTDGAELYILTAMADHRAWTP